MEKSTDGGDENACTCGHGRKAHVGDGVCLAFVKGAVGPVDCPCQCYAAATPETVRPRPRRSRRQDFDRLDTAIAEVIERLKAVQEIARQLAKREPE